ncbi:MAG: ThiF family adenylyltransferase [Planctomycetaceae bacterium]
MPELSRYQKQILFAEIGEAGQRRLMQRQVLLVGCGALGCVLADAMVRAGVGHVRIVDRDFVELSNLQRQILFTEDDVAEHIPKAVAAARRLRRVNSGITIEPIVADVGFSNIRQFADGADLILDGSDNFEVRYLINDLSLETGIPWIFTGCTGSTGQVMPVIPGETACLRCLIPDPPPPGSTETCDTAGVIGPAIGVTASLQATLALKLLSGEQYSPKSGGGNYERRDAGKSKSSRSIFESPKLTIIDVWDGTFRQVDVSGLRNDDDCPACKHGERLWLDGTQSSGSTVLCGRNAVQISPPEKVSLSLGELAGRLDSAGTVTSNPFLVRVAVRGSDLELTVFPDGRAIVKGTEDSGIARAVYSRYVGS